MPFFSKCCPCPPDTSPRGEALIGLGSCGPDGSADGNMRSRYLSAGVGLLFVIGACAPVIAELLKQDHESSRVSAYNFLRGFGYIYGASIHMLTNLPGRDSKLVKNAARLQGPAFLESALWNLSLATSGREETIAGISCIALAGLIITINTLKERASHLTERVSSDGIKYSATTAFAAFLIGSVLQLIPAIEEPEANMPIILALTCFAFGAFVETIQNGFRECCSSATSQSLGSRV